MIVIPVVVANATVMSYIATNHFMRPQTETNDPIENSMSVDDAAAHRSSALQLQPPRRAPLVPAHERGLRAAPCAAGSEANAADRYVSPPHHAALTALYRTPRVYLDATTLCDPEDLGYTVHTDDLAAAFVGR